MLLELISADGVRELAEHAGFEVLEHGLEDDFVADHFLLEKLDVEPARVLATRPGHLVAHVKQNRRQIRHEEQRHAYFFVRDKDAGKHGRLHHSVEDVGFLQRSAAAVHAADEDDRVDADPFALLVETVFFAGLGNFDFQHLLEECFDNRSVQVQMLLQVLDLPLGPRNVALDSLRAVSAPDEAGADREISDEGAQKKLCLQGVRVEQMGKYFSVVECFNELLAVDEPFVLV